MDSHEGHLCRFTIPGSLELFFLSPKINKSSGFHRFSMGFFISPIHCEQRLRLLTQQRSFLLRVMTQGIPRNQNSIVHYKSNIYTSEIDTKDTKNGHISYLKGVTQQISILHHFGLPLKRRAVSYKKRGIFQAAPTPNQKFPRDSRQASQLQSWVSGGLRILRQWSFEMFSWRSPPNSTE